MKFAQWLAHFSTNCFWLHADLLLHLVLSSKPAIVNNFINNWHYTLMTIMVSLKSKCNLSTVIFHFCILWKKKKSKKFVWFEIFSILVSLVEKSSQNFVWFEKLLALSYHACFYCTAYKWSIVQVSNHHEKLKYSCFNGHFQVDLGEPVPECLHSGLSELMMRLWRRWWQLEL